MQVFVTGAAGFIGQVTVTELQKSGHSVLGLCRSDANEKVLKSLGAVPHHGSLEDLDSLKRGAAQSDAVIHLAFSNDFADFVGGCAKDRAAIEAIGEAIKGTAKPFVVTSGTLLLPSGELVTENDKPDMSLPLPKLRGPSELAALALARNQVKAMVMRLPPTNHGAGDKGFIKILVEKSRELGYAVHVGADDTVWPAVHRKDTAKAYVKAIEHGEAGKVYHAVAESGVNLKEVAAVISEKLALDVKTLTVEEAMGAMGFLAGALGTSNPASSEQTRLDLGWEPDEIGLIDDLKAGHYFDDYKAFSLEKLDT